MDTKEVLGAALELAKPVVDLGCQLIQDVLGKPLKVAGSMLVDQVYAWQWTNRISIARKAKQIMDDHGIAAQVLPPGFFVPLLIGAGDVGDPDLQELWAQLLASAVYDSIHQHPAYSRILQQLCRDEAVVLGRLRKSSISVLELVDFDHSTHTWSNKRVVENDFPGELTHAEMALDYVEHLNGLALAFRPSEKKAIMGKINGKQDQVGEEISSVVLLTTFGGRFLDACMPKAKRNLRGSGKGPG